MSTAAKTPNYNLSQVAGSDIPDWITDYTSDMSKIDDALKGNADDIATVRPDEFSEESTYAAGDYCIKDNVTYKAKTAVEAGAFDISDWTATTIFDELSGLNQNMLRVATFDMTLTYSSANALMASVDHNLGVTPRACIAQISSTDGSLRDFGYVLSAGATSGRVTAYAYSASKWSSGDSVEVQVAAFF